MRETRQFREAPLDVEGEVTEFPVEAEPFVPPFPSQTMIRWMVDMPLRHIAYGVIGRMATRVHAS